MIGAAQALRVTGLVKVELFDAVVGVEAEKLRHTGRSDQIIKPSLAQKP